MEQHGEWSLREGDVHVIPAGEPHRMLELERSEYWGLALSVPCFSANDTELLGTIDCVRDGASAVVRVPTNRHAFLEELFRELSAATHASEAVRRSLLTLILAEVDRARGLEATRSSSGRSGVVVESLRFIEKNCLRKLTLDEIAAAVGRTPAHVTTALKRSTGRTAVEWVTAGRMAEARRRLAHSEERVEVVAERVGYADSTHFIRMFRRTHGATPTAWRASRRTSPA